MMYTRWNFFDFTDVFLETRIFHFETRLADVQYRPIADKLNSCDELFTYSGGLT